MIAVSFSIWRHVRHIGVLKQRKGGHVGVSKQSCGILTFFLCKKGSNKFTSLLATLAASYSWFATTWHGDNVGGQYNRIFSRRIYMKIEFSSQRGKMLLFLTTSIAAVTSPANQQYGSRKLEVRFSNIQASISYRFVNLVLKFPSSSLPSLGWGR